MGSTFPQLSPLLFIEAGHLRVEVNDIDPYITLEHEDTILTFKHIGHSLIYGNHFTLQTFINEKLVSYDRIRSPKIQVEEPSKFPEIAKINFIAFNLVV